MKGIRDRRVRAVAAFVCAYSSTISMASAKDGVHGPRGHFNLDLSSTASNVNFSKRLADSVNIQVGDSVKTVSAGDKLTAAQAMAAYQVMRNNSQSIMLGSQGNAVGGTVNLGPKLQRHLTGMYIPTGVTVVDNVARNGQLNLRGDFVNDGSFIAVSTNPTIDTARISADNIRNNQGALLSTASAGVNGANANLNLSLTAQHDIVNAGTITSSGNLDATAGRSIVNALPSGASGAAPSMQAFNDVNLNSASVINNGTIAAQVGNINIASQTALEAASGFNQLNVDNTGGVFQALNGSINVGNTTSSSDIGLAGGDWLSKEMNVTAGDGTIAANVGKVSGTLHSSASVEHFNADTDNLVLGNNCITGDPTFANTGTITINGTLTVNEDLAIIAGGDVVATAAGAIVNLSGAPTYIIAGADITAGGNTGGQFIPFAGPNPVPVTMSFDVGFGGNIDFSATTAFSMIQTNGGALTMLAHSNAAGNGNVWFPTTGSGEINTQSVAGIGGDVNIFAGGTGGTAPSASGPIIAESISTSLISTTGSTGSGNVSLIAGQPTITSGPSATFNTNGTTAATFGHGAVVNGGSIAVFGADVHGQDGKNGLLPGTPGTPGQNGGSIFIQSGGSITTGNLVTSGGSGGTGQDAAFGSATIGGAGGPGGDSGAITLLATTNISTASLVAISGSGGNGGAGADDLNNGAAGGQGGVAGTAANITLTGTGTVFFSSIFAGGGSGGFGGAGGSGGITNGNGGSSGSGGKGSTVQINAGDVGTSLNAVGLLSITGGDGGQGGSGDTGGFGGAGGQGGTLTVTSSASVNMSNIQTGGGNGGFGAAGLGGGDGGGAGSSGSISLTGGALVFVGGSIDASGGQGGGGGVALSNANGGLGGFGGDGAVLSVTAGGANITLGSVSVNGGNSGSGGFSSGNGAGGSSQSAGLGGTVSATNANNISIGPFSAHGGSGGAGGASGVFGTGGAGGSGRDGGTITLNGAGFISIGDLNAAGGSGSDGGGVISGTSGNGGAGGAGGILTVTGGGTVISGFMNMFGGSAGSSGNLAGAGTAGKGGTAGGGGSVTVNSLVFSSTGAIDVSGGTGGGSFFAPAVVTDTGGNGGVGGAVTLNGSQGVGFLGAGLGPIFADGGLAGDGSTGGIGGKGGTVSISSTTSDIFASSISARGNDSGTDNKGGDGGTITVNASGVIGDPTQTIGSLAVDGGDSSGAFTAGKGGNVNITSGFASFIGSVSLDGGEGVRGATGGAGGTLTVLAGTSLDFAVISALGGVGGTSVLGVPGGTGGKGGTVNLTATNDIGGTAIGTINARGGDGGDGDPAGAGGAGGSITLHGQSILSNSFSAIGGTGGTGLSDGSASQPGGTGGNGGLGGTITVVATNNAQITTVVTSGGSGGTGGFGTSAGTGGAGGLGGQINLTADQDLSIDGLLSSNGGTGGAGQVGNSTSSNGGVGGAGGTVIATATNDDLFIAQFSLNGGTGGSGGDRGIAANSGTGGAGGIGGTVTLTAFDFLEINQGTVNGGVGGSGGGGGSGGVGGIGGSGSKAGTLTVTANSMTTDVLVSADGGAGGAGGQGGGSGGPGGVGGSGGQGGSLNFTASQSMNISDLSAAGGNGGPGGNASSQPFATDNGGDGGSGNNAGTITLLAGFLTPINSGFISLTGGAGGPGGQPSPSGGSVGNTGASGVGGTLIATTTLGSVGDDESNPIRTDADKLTLNAPNNSGVFAFDTAATTTIIGSNGAQTYDLRTTGDLVISAAPSIPSAEILILQADDQISIPGNIVSVNQATGGFGGQIQLTADTIIWGSQATLPLTLNANGIAGGGFVSVTLLSGGATIGSAFGDFLLSAEGQDGGAVEFHALNGNLLVNTTGLLVGPLGANGRGGSITLEAQDIARELGGTLQLSADGSGTGDGGSLNIRYLSDPGPVIIAPAGNLNLSAAGENGGLISVSTLGSLLIDTAGLNVSAGANGNGGTLQLAGNTVNNSSSGTLILDVSGNGTGSGGTILINQLTTASATIGGPSGPGDFQLNATSGGTGGNGGTVQFITGGDLTVNPAAINVAALAKVGDFGGVFLSADNLIINGSFNLSSKTGGGGNVTLQSNSSTPFNYGGVFGGNGFASGTINVAGKTFNGVVAINNVGGNVNINTGITKTRTIFLSSSAALNINVSVGDKSTQFLNLAGDSGINLPSGKVKLTAGSIAIGSIGGSLLTATGDPIAVTAGVLTINVSGGANISDKSAVQLNSSSVGGNLTLTSKGTINTANASDVIAADILTLVSKKGIGTTNTLKFNANTLQLNTKGLSSLESVRSGLFQLGSSQVGTLDLTAAGPVNVTGVFGTTKSNIDLNVTTAGDIETVGIGIINAGSLHVSTVGGAIGLAAPFRVNAATVAASADDKVDIFDEAKSVTLGDISVGNGSIKVVTDVETKGLIVADGASITAQSGSISLDNLNNTKGFIEIGVNANIATSGLAGADVSIFLGTSPPPQVGGSAPANVSVVGAGGTAFFGANGITAAAPDNILTLINADIIFDTGGLAAKAIKLDGGVSITADPPLTAGQALQVMSFATPSVTGNSTKSMANVSTGFAANQSGFVGNALDAVPANQSIGSGLNAIASQSTVNALDAGLRINLIDVTRGQDSDRSLTNGVSIKDSQISTADVSKYSDEFYEATSADFESGEFEAHVIADHDLGLNTNANAANVEIGDAENASRRVALHRGSLVVASKTPVCVETAFGEISVGAKSVVLLMSTPNSVAVYNLDDWHRDAVHVNAGNKKISLSPGRHAVITWSHVKSFDSINPAESFGYRNVASTEIANGLRAFTGEFSIPGAINTVKQLRHLATRKHSGSEQMVDHLIKTTAVLMHLQGGAPYQQVLRPRVAAYNP